MTLESTITSQTMLGNGVTRSWPFPFKAWANQVKVLVTSPGGVQTDVTASSGIIVHGGADIGGVVTYPVPEGTPPLAAGWKITVMRDMDFKQSTDLVTGSRYLSEVIENRLDRLTAQDQQLREKLDRAVTVPPASGQTPEELLEDLFQARDTATEKAAMATEKAVAAAGSADLAHKWATNPEDAVVEAGEYSAYHWAQKSKTDADSIKSLWASAEGVPHTAPPEAAYTAASGEMHFKIPKGEPGPPGAAPALDIIDCGHANQTHLFLIDCGQAGQATA
jgi:hypothetical protein